MAIIVLHHYGKIIAIIKEGRKIHTEKELKTIHFLLSVFIGIEHLGMKHRIKSHIHRDISKMKVNARYLKAATCVIPLRTEKQAVMVGMKKENHDGGHRENGGETRTAN